MLLHRPFRLLASSALAALFSCNAAAEPAGTNSPAPPPEQTVTYADTNGFKHVYLLQEPRARPIATNAPILIYMHGAGGKEEQGMRTLFPGLRQLLNAWGWIYVCPRDGEYADLRSDLAARYGPRPIFLAGASAGGRSVFWEAVQNPSPYSGLILMCPAVLPRTIPDSLTSDARILPMPLWMICGEQDAYYATTCSLLNEALNTRRQPVYYREIPGGDHDVPCRLIKWDEALRFVAEKSGTDLAVQ
jgi:pimeloyl-ACP methyl ester carboxylesterase